MKVRLAEFGYAAGWVLARHVPERAVHAVFRRLADRTWRSHGSGVRRLERNLARVLDVPPGDPVLRDASHDALRSYFRYWAEVFRLPALDRDGIRARVEVQRVELVQAAVRERGAVTALPHMGNWDLAGAYAAYHEMPVTAVVERLRPESLFRRFAAYREGIGIEVVPQGRADVLPLLVRRAQEHRLIALVADRLVGSARTGVDVEFFGAPTRMPLGPALVALRAGVPLFPLTLWYDGIARMRVHDAVQVPETGDELARAAAMTRAVARVFEQGVREHPADWHMLQPVWTADLPGRRTGTAGAAPAGTVG